MAATAVPVRAPVDAASVAEASLELFSTKGYRATTMADIGAALGIRGPSLYKHVRAKQDLLTDIMLETMHTLIDHQRRAASLGGDVTERLQRMVEAHVRYHAEHRREAFVGNREIGSLVSDHRVAVLALRDSYERGLRAVIEEGCEAGVFSVESSRVTSYAILDMGIGVATWFRADGPHSVREIEHLYGDIALKLVGVSA